MLRILLVWLISSAAVWITTRVVPGFRVTNGFKGALLVAAIFGVLNLLIGKLLFAVMVVGTLGIGLLFSFLLRWIANTIVLKVTDVVSETLEINSWTTAAIASAIISVLTTIGEWLLTVRG